MEAEIYIEPCELPTDHYLASCGAVEIADLCPLRAVHRVLLALIERGAL